MIGNGVCNDEANNENCKYDGGDCCLKISSPDNCKHAETCTAGKRQIYISQVLYTQWSWAVVQREKKFMAYDLHPVLIPYLVSQNS